MFQEENNMESLTYQKNLKSSPKKMRMIRDLIVKMKPSEALPYLMFSPSKSAKIYYKVIKSAINNATATLKVTADMLKFRLLIVEEGRKLKRFNAGSKGMAKPIVKSYSHVKVVLVESNEKPVLKTESSEDLKENIKAPQKKVLKEAKTKTVKGIKKVDSPKKEDKKIKVKKNK